MNGDVVVAYSKANYWVHVVDPCTYPEQIIVPGNVYFDPDYGYVRKPSDEGIVVPDDIPDIDYWIKDNEVSSTFAYYEDWTTYTYGN
jgi:hypothetical protein